MDERGDGDPGGHGVGQQYQLAEGQGLTDDDRENCHVHRIADVPVEAADDQILGAARELFSERGFAGTSMEAIREKAGVSKPTVYNYYPAKEELFVDVLRRHIDENFGDWRGFSRYPRGVAGCPEEPGGEVLRHVDAARVPGVDEGGYLRDAPLSLSRGAPEADGAGADDGARLHAAEAG